MTPAGLEHDARDSGFGLHGSMHSARDSLAHGTPALELRDVGHRFGQGDAAVTALHGVSLNVQAGELVAVMGASGSGKSTLLACAAGLLPPTCGEVLIRGQRLSGLDDDGLTEMRRTKLGFVFQEYNLVPSLSAHDNVMLPASLGGDIAESERVAQLCDRLGITDRLDHRPDQLSGGQQQRVALARALSMRPSIVFADEPTGALDTVTAADVLDLLVEEAQLGQAIVVVTHDPVVASRADRLVFLRDGRVAQTSARLPAERIARVLLELIATTGSGQ